MQSPQICKVITIILSTIIVIHCFPKTALALELNTGIREYFRSQVEKRDKLSDSVNTTIKQSLNQNTELVTKVSRGGFSLFEKQYGLDEQNKLYQGVKNHVLQDVGFRLGAIKGIGDFTSETFSLAATLDTLPARTITLAYNVNEQPREYLHKGVSALENSAQIIVNIPSILNNACQQWQKNYDEAKKDPIELGKLNGEVTVFGTSLLLGGGQVKALAKTNKLTKVYPKASIDELAPLIKNNKRLPMNEGVVRSIAEMSGVDLTGVKIKIKNKATFDFNGEILASTSRFSNKITFYKGAFRNWEKLSYATGHEATHLSQLAHNRIQLFKTSLQAPFSKNGMSKYEALINKMEKGAYATHEQWIQNLVKSFNNYEKSKSH